MTLNGGKVHVVRVSKTGYVDKQGRRKDYSSAYLRRTYRDGGKVKNETVANLSALPDHVIDLIDAGLKGQQLVPAGEAVTITGSLPHGHAAAVHAMAKPELGLPALLGPAGRHRDLALALIISRVVKPGSKLSTLTWWADTTLGADLGVADAPPMTSTPRWTGWGTGRTRSRPSWPAATWPRRPTRRRWPCSTCPARGWKARRCPLAARGYSRDGKKGRLQIEYGLLTDPEGRPVAVRVFPGNTGDPAAFTQIADGGAGEVRAGPDGHGRRPRHDHLRPHPGPEPAGGRNPAAGRLRVDHRAARPGHPKADGRRRAAAAVTCSTSRTSPRSPRRTSPASG